VWVCEDVKESGTDCRCGSFGACETVGVFSRGLDRVDTFAEGLLLLLRVV
jgi:hypothetical protein